MTRVTRPGPAQPIVGIDIGGTKTHLRLRGDGADRDLVLPTAEWRRREWAADAAALLDILKGFTNGLAIAALGVGAHGCDDADECNSFTEAFRARTTVPVTVVNDAELMPLALGYHGEIGVVAGTGSIAVCRSPAGEMLVAGGWGWIIGDEGSAASLVREATRAVALHLDTGGGLDEPLCAALFAALQVPAPARLGSTLGALGNAAAVGRHAPVVFAAADAGSAIAQRVITEGGAALADLVRRLELQGAVARHAVAGGSVIAGQPRLWEAFRAGLREVCGDRITPHVFTGQPVEGACRLAEGLLDAALGPARARSA